MDSFIFYNDYAKTIQGDLLQQIIGSKQSILDSIQLLAVEECRSYLKSKYDTSKALLPITKHDKTISYLAGRNVYLDATAFSALSTYALGAYTLYDTKVYICSTAITVAGAWNASKWTLLGNQYDIFNTIIPKPIFDYQTIYAVGDEVFFEDKTYICKIATQILSHQSQLEIGEQVQSSIVNIFPNDSQKGVTYWGVGTAYSVPANTQITDTTKWSLGDARDQKLLQVCIDIALYHVHSRIAPQNIPAIRVIRYMGNSEDRVNGEQRVLYPTYSALGWLQACTIGNDVVPNMPIIQSNIGNRINFGGQPKNENHY